MKKKRFRIKINNRTFYTVISLAIFLIVGIGVFALTPGTAPNPGHSLTDVAPPSPCNSGEIILWDGSNLICKNAGWIINGANISYIFGKVGINNNNPSASLDIIGNFKLNGSTNSTKYCSVDGQNCSNGGLLVQARGFDCGSDNYVRGFYANGSAICAVDQVSGPAAPPVCSGLSPECGCSQPVCTYSGWACAPCADVSSR